MKENKVIVELFYEQLWNKWDFNMAKILLAENVVFRGSIGLTKRGRKGFIEYANIVKSAFPDFHNSIEELIIEQNKAVARLTFTGTHKGELFSKKPTGKKIEYCGVAIFTIRNGFISHIWVLGDLYNLMRQIDSRQSDSTL